ncbi:SHOCT domain-containing protein [Lysinibacter cavernae]|uniref:Putative membrane protein n=1 Tax=Lysinibacter cavernae TaxID=1640652 RepID=A0A7X5R256_9MICO|nr:hypothetical protein [Lysinibacter cavernae]NIH54102.1 putative membrane protein [Lysinibacter cavernae]
MIGTVTAATVAAHAWGPGIGFGWMFFVFPLFWILIIGLIVSFAARRRRAAWREAGYPDRGWGGPHGPQRFSASGGAEATLAERFAQGDIDEVEYRARLEVLRANR